jgi:hypothetical protein
MKTAMMTRPALHRRQMLKLGGALGLGAVLPLWPDGLLPHTLAQADVWAGEPDLAKAAEQAKDFQTYGMPDD